MALVKEVPWKSSSAELHMSDALSAEEQRAVEQRLKDMDMLFGSEPRRATYKLEVIFNDERSFHHPFGGIVTLWESGNKLHGGGDTKLYLCPGQELKNNGCDGLLADTTRGLRFMVCAKCGSMWRPEQVHGEVFYKLTMGKWADVLLQWFTRLNLDADIRLKYARDDIRTVATLEQERQMRGELLAKARSEERMSTSIYPLTHIIKDTSNGAGLHGRILAFLKS